jgi:predicted transposase YbfD/YdcC
LLHVRRNTPTLAVRGELGRYPITLKAIARSLKFFHQTINKSEDKLAKQALTESIRLNEEGANTWFTKLDKTRKTLQLPCPPSNLTKYQQKKFNQTIERTLEAGYKKFWIQQINNTTSKAKNKGGNKLRTYSKLKQNFAIEKYLTHIEDTSQRASTTQLRLSSHPLNIETLRGTIPNPCDRVCQMCDLNVAEDEFHLLTICPHYETLRETILSTSVNNPNIHILNKEDKAIWLLTNEDKNICKALGKYIHACFKERKNTLHTTNTAP